jgi:inhibitor of KinA
MSVKYLCSGDKAVTVEFGNDISEEIAERVTAMKRSLDENRTLGIVEVVQTYRSLLIYYDPSVWSYKDLVEELEKVERNLEVKKTEKKRVIDIPVLYGGVFGPDLRYIADLNRATEADIVKRHISKDYMVYMVGFTPGFPYLGKLDESIMAPRKSSPRLKVPKGSVGIAGNQTGIYPMESPGGWNIIGITPVNLYSLEWDRPALLEPGDYVRFRSVDENEYRKIENEVKKKGEKFRWETWK